MADNTEFPASSTLDSRGRTTIPASIRRALGWRPGDRLHWTVDPGGFVLVKLVRRRRLQRVGSSPVPHVGGINTTAELVRLGHLVSEAEFHKLMGWSSGQAVASALATRRVFAMELDSKRYFPSFFADPAYAREHLEAVAKQLGNLPGGAKFQFFVSRKGSLNGKTVLEALEAGKLELVLRLATAYSEQR